MTDRPDWPPERIEEAKRRAFAGDGEALADFFEDGFEGRPEPITTRPVTSPTPRAVRRTDTEEENEHGA